MNLGSTSFLTRSSLRMVSATVLAGFLLGAGYLWAGPTITGVSPLYGRPGDVVIITGSGFNPDPTQINVSFGPNRAAVLSASGTQIVIQLPNGQPGGLTNIVVDSNDCGWFTVIGDDDPTNPTHRCDNCGCPTGTCPVDNEPVCPIEAADLGGTLGGRSGNLYAERGEFFQRVTDLKILGRPGAADLVNYSFQRNYRAQLDIDGPLGHNWEHNYFERLDIGANSAVMHVDGLGRRNSYRMNNTGKMVAPPEMFAELVHNANNSYTLHFRGGLTKTFEADGKLLEIRDRNNSFLSFFYNEKRQLVRVNDSLARDIVYRYIVGGPNDGRLREIQDFMGRRVAFNYDTNGDLVDVTSPIVLEAPNGNDFPQGKTTRYTYSTGFADARLNHNLLSITRPNEVANGGPPTVTNVYGTDPGSFHFDKLIQQTYGGVNTSGVPAGGVFLFEYSKLNAAVTSDDPNLPVSRTRMTDRSGEVVEYDFNRLGYPLVTRELTRGVRRTDPPAYVTTMLYNADGRLVQKTLPSGSRTQYFYDEGNPDRLRRGNLLRVVQTPDSRGADQKVLTTTYTYDERFGLVKTITDPRGNDSSYVPPNGGKNGTERYTTTFIYDYEVNSAISKGNVVQRRKPSVILPDGTSQAIVTDYTYNRFGQLSSETDPEGNVTQYSYFPENDPAGDGHTSLGTRADLDNSTGGYLKQKILDASTSGRRTESTNPTALTNQFFYDPAGNMIRSVDGRGNDKLLTVNALNQVVRTQSESPYRYVEDVFYDFNDNIIRRDVENRVAASQDGKPVFTSNGNFNSQAGVPAFFQHRFTFDILDKIVKQDLDATGSSPSRLITAFRYDSDERPILQILPEGNMVASIYDERGLLFSTTRGSGAPEASTYTYSYDADRNLVSMVDAEDKNGDGKNDETVYQYDGFDRKTTSIDTVGNKIAFNYDPNSQMVKETTYGSIGGPSPSNTLGSGNTVLSQREFRRDELNRAYQIDDLLFVAVGVVPLRRPVLTEGPLSPGDQKLSRRLIFDRNNRVVREVQDDLDTSSKDYDGLNRITKATDPQGNSKAYSYDANNNAILQVAAEVSQKQGVSTEIFTTSYQYDALNRLTVVSDNCKNTTRSAYDSRGNLTHRTDAKGDGMLGCSGVTNEQGNSIRHMYDGMNRRIQTVRDLRAGGLGSSGVETSNSFNADGQIVTSYVYDANGRMRTITDDNGKATAYAYDAINRIVQELLSDGSIKTYGYDRNDNLVSLKDPNGTVQNNVYDAFNRRIRSTVLRAPGVVGSTVGTWEYDGLSRITRMTDNNDPADAGDDSVVTLTYDSLGRLIEENQNGKAVDGDWFGAERRVGLTYPNDRKLNYSYDALDRIKTIQDSGVNSTIAQYNYVGPWRVLERQYQNGVRLTYLDNAGAQDIGYDGARRMIAQRHLRADNSLVAGFTHIYDRVDNRRDREKLHSPGNSEVYSYDSASRITSAQRGMLTGTKDGLAGSALATQTWGLDGVNNWRLNTVNGLAEAREVNNVNEYSTIGASRLFYDKNGNLVNNGSLGFRWDYKNRLQQVCFLDPKNPNGVDGIPGTPDDCLASGALPISTYAYDAMNRRIHKTVTNSGPVNGETAFYYDRWRTIEERGAGDKLLQQYVYGIYVDEVLAMDRNVDGDNSATGPADERLFYHQDTQYSIAALTTSDGRTVEGYEYDTYGRQTVVGPDFTTAQSTISGKGNPFTFTGQRLDAETGMMYYKNRYYSTALGRFLQRDPLGIWHDQKNLGNAFSYVGNNPVNSLDPTGEWTWCRASCNAACWAAGAAICAAIACGCAVGTVVTVGGLAIPCTAVVIGGCAASTGGSSLCADIICEEVCGP